LQKVKKNKDECIQLAESLRGVLYAIINLHMKSDPPGNLPPANLYHVGQFTEYTVPLFMWNENAHLLCRTLHKIHTYVELAQEGNKLKHFFHQSEMNNVLKACHDGLQEAAELFNVRGVT
jgi:hypothetical protein